MDSYRVGECVYKVEVLELLKKLKAEGIVLIVIKGNRNKNDYEVSAAVEAKHLFSLSEVMAINSVKMRQNIMAHLDGIVQT